MRRIRVFLVFASFLSCTVNSWAWTGIQLHTRTEAPKQNEEAASNIAGDLEYTIREAIRKEFPCPELVTIRSEGVKELVDALGELERNGGYYFSDSVGDPDSYAIKMNTKAKVKKSLGKDLENEVDARDLSQSINRPRFYIISNVILEKSNGGTAVVIQLELLDTHEKKTPKLYSAIRKTTLAGAGGEVQKLAAEVVKNLAYAEPCPYKGKVTVKLVTDRDGNHELYEDHIVSCNGVERKFQKFKLHDEYKKETWELNRGGNPYAWGVATTDWGSYFEFKTYDGCPPCKKDCRDCLQIEGKGMTVHYKQPNYPVVKAQTGNGPDQYNVVPDGPGSDVWHNEAAARVELKFDKNGRYTVSVKALLPLMDNSVLSQTKEWASGPCKEIPVHVTHEEKGKGWVPLDRTWGPFTGTPFQHRLKEEKIEEKKNPDIREKWKMTLEFNLERAGGK